MLNIMMSEQFRILKEKRVTFETIFIPQLFALIPVLSALVVFDLIVAARILAFIILFFYIREVYKKHTLDPKWYNPNFCFFLALQFLWFSGIAYILYLDEAWTISGLVSCLLPFLLFVVFSVVGKNNYRGIKYHKS